MIAVRTFWSFSPIKRLLPLLFYMWCGNEKGLCAVLWNHTCFIITFHRPRHHLRSCGSRATAQLQALDYARHILTPTDKLVENAAFFARLFGNCVCLYTKGFDCFYSSVRSLRSAHFSFFVTIFRDKVVCYKSSGLTGSDDLILSSFANEGHKANAKNVNLATYHIPGNDCTAGRILPLRVRNPTRYNKYNSAELRCA